MSITLPPLPPLPAFRPPEHGDATEAFSLYLHACNCTHKYATTYALAAVEADRASRVPMTRKQCEDLIGSWNAGTYSTLYALVRVVEAHFIGAKP